MCIRDRYMTDLSQSDDGDGHIIGRFVYDHLFNIVLMILLLNILFGIIIDTFAQLRDENEQRKGDMVNSCTVCSISRSTFDRQTTLGHTFHIKGEHNMWDYCCLTWHLRTKTQTEFTGVESYLAKCIQSGDLRFFPVLRAMTLGGKLWQDEGTGDQNNFAQQRRDHDDIVQSEIQSLKESVAMTNKKLVQLLHGMNPSSNSQTVRRRDSVDSFISQPQQQPRPSNLDGASPDLGTQIDVN
eukprot:TRINITY_DN7084_c0_g1_i3.p1 TRINITY_DN7084_c0_g1~~TRINITY_DN7084_c0_g1_i3.p1  ORF type:complete len:240 (+),score=36.27 TRINITY_DN7084_c0_g1_i3:136-855(+)